VPQLWRQPDFLKLWTGQAVSRLGSSITSIAIPLAAVLILGASPLQMGLLAGASGAATLVFGLFAGAWADRLRRRPILILTDLGRAAVLGTVPLAAALHRLTMGHLYAVSAAAGILTVFFDVSYQSWLPSFVGRDNILEGNSKLALTESIADVAGPGLTGVLVKLITAPMAILMDAVSFLCSAISIALIRAPEPRPQPTLQPRIFAEILEGLHASWGQPILRAMVKQRACASFFLGFGGSLYMVFAIRELGLSAAVLGAVISIGGASALLGPFAAERLVRLFGPGPVLIGATLLAGIAMLLPPLAHGSVALATAYLSVAQVFDIAWPIFNITELTLRQAVAPDRLLGRINSAMHLLLYGIMPAGALAGGILAQWLGIRATLFLAAIGFLLSTLWFVFSPVRTLRTLPEPVPTS
jgi:predicted MFS family arabinose efflux permease